MVDEPEDILDAEDTLEGGAPDTEAAEQAEAKAREELEATARSRGWKSPDEWKGDKANYIEDPEEFVRLSDSAPATIRRLKEQIEKDRAEFDDRISRIQGMQDDVVKRAREQAVEDARAKMRDAASVGDMEAHGEAERRYAEAMKPPEPEKKAEEPKGYPPETVKWLDENPWIKRNAAIRGELESLGNEAWDAGIRDTAGQIAYAEAELRKAYPQFAPPAATPRRPVTSAVDGGGMAGGARRGKTAADLPAEARRAAEGFVKEGIYRSVDDYARSYFKEFPNG